MANHDHADNIGTHPAFSKDPETALRARLEAAQVQRTRAEENYTKARNNLRVFLEAQEREARLAEAMTRHVEAHRAQVQAAEDLGLISPEDCDTCKRVLA